ncbi:hypothetical protein [Streptomyces sp. NBC_01408]|uniref:hypothetical protein n=1 Tax=Streptomyces sp. NBC_01408 TaxID=2903855 RepID=UPI00225C2E8C|nr:hypothetical protein [Streptomyces sp. NBC_01408]MCX4692730.1 hypothetical protein [Streptomyces sp. NBC_01408]
MSAREERPALSSRTASLYDYALFRHGIEPEGRVPRRGYPLPDGVPPEPSRKGLTWKQAQAEVSAALTPLLADPDPVRAAEAVHRRASELGMPHRTVRAHTAPLTLTDKDAARRTARQLVRSGTDLAAVSVGIALLIRLGEAEDVPHLKVLGMLRGLDSAAAAALEPLDRQAAALLVIRGHDRSGELTELTGAIEAGDARRTLSALIAVPDEHHLYFGRRIAEAADLRDLIRAHPQDPALLALAARLLHRMADQRDSRSEIVDYLPARAVYEALVRHADLLPPTPEHHALLLSIAFDLHSGPPALLRWRLGRREALLDGLDRLLAGRVGDLVADPGTPADRRRVDWIRRTGRTPFLRTAAAGPSPRWEVVVVHGPDDSPGVETRILVDGRPLLPALFANGPGGSPESLLDSGDLRAGEQPREVRLAEAGCTEGCCGALYVTIRRDGTEVVWGDWRGATGAPPPEYRFKAAAYDAELERAERDHSWCWPARSTARLISAGLRERPELLGRWGLRQSWISTDWRDPDTTALQLAFTPPGTTESLYFAWHLPDDGRPPAEQAAAALDRIEAGDPKEFARLSGGSRELAESLGYSWPP